MHYVPLQVPIFLNLRYFKTNNKINTERENSDIRKYFLLSVFNTVLSFLRISKSAFNYATYMKYFFVSYVTM